MAQAPKKRSDCSVDFSGVESGGRSLPDGDYLLELASIPEEKESSEGNPYIAWKWKVCEGPHKGTLVYDNTSLKSTALWRLKLLLECMGEEVPNGKMGLNFKSYLGNKVSVKIANETYQGKERPRIAEFIRPAVDASSSSGTSSPFKKGQRVSFDFEGSVMEGTVSGVEADSIVVEVEVDGSKEEWELSPDELTIAS